jgi:RhoGEF domain
LLANLFNRDEFKQAYTDYCYHYKITDQAIKTVMTGNTTFVEHLKTIGLTSISLTLESYMIKPVQRLCKYGLIINEYFRNMETDHVDYKDI